MFRLRSILFSGVALLLGLLTSGQASELGRVVVQNISIRDMNNRGYQPGPAFQDDDGTVYFGDWSQVAVYDGTAWQTVDVPFGRLVRGPAQGPDGKIYVGGNNLLGYLRASAYGRKEFVSLVDQLPEAERDFRGISAVAPLPDGVAFVASTKLLLWRDDAFSVLDHGGARPCVDGNTLYLHAPGGPLRRLDGNQFTTVTDDPRLAQTQVAWVQRDPAGALLIGTTDRGLFRLQNGRLAPLPTAVDDLFASTRLDCALRLPDGSLALALQERGLFFLDANGKLLTTLNESNGLMNRGNNVRGLLLDREGGLWISHVGGVSRAEWPGALTAFDSLNGLGNLPLRQVRRIDGTLYTTGTGGAFRLVPGTAANPARFEFVPGSPEIRSLIDDPDGALGATPAGLVQLRDGAMVSVFSFTRASGAPAYRLVRSARDPNRLWIGQVEGLRSVRRTADGWIDEGLVPGLDRPIIEILELPDGTLWMAKAVDGFVRVRFTAGGTDPRGTAEITHYAGGNGLPAKLAANNSVKSWRGQPLFVTDYSVYLHDDATDRFVPFTAFGERLNLPPLTITTAQPSADGGLWIAAVTAPPGAEAHRSRRIYYAANDRDWRQVRHLAFDVLHIAAYYGTWEEAGPDGPVVWLGGSQGLVRIDVKHAFAPLAPLPTRLRAEAIHDGQTWSDQTPRRDATDPRNPPASATPSPTLEPPFKVLADSTIAHRFRSLKFSYATASHLYGADLRYQTRLEGFESDWSPWTAERSRIFTNLPAGRYVFHVRGDTSDGHMSHVATMAFTVLPPWWLTGWAWAGYAIAAVFLVAGIVRFRSRQLRLANEKLEAIVDARTEELRVNEQRLRIARDGAESANRAKTAFLANMSHELRTPLNAVLGYAQIVLRDDQLPPDHRRRVNAIAQGGEHLLQMINEVLDLSKIEADKVELAPRPCSLPRLLAAVSEMFQLRASQRGLAFSYRQSTPLPETVLADEGRLRQVLINLLENAVKFTEPGGRVDFEVGCRDGRVHFAVRDTGPGIPAADVARIFQPFQQAGSSSARQQGAGLGLAISQRLVELMGGSITVESAAGRGSCFQFTVTLPETAPRHSRNPFDFRPTGYRGPRRRVLIVDDEATNRQVLREMLEPLGFVLSEATDGPGAVAAVRADAPDLVLMDIRLPKLNGLAATEQIRALPNSHAVRIVAVSASVFSSDREEAVARGCDEFLPKPFREAQLLGVIGRLFNLEWIDPAATAGASPAVTTDATARPARAELEALATLAADGKVVALRARLAALRPADPRSTAWIDRLDALAAEFQMTRLSEEIARALDENPPAR